MNGPSPETLTLDAFLGGRLKLWQPRQGYRAGIDPVLLAASVEARAGQHVLDLGCGVGAAVFCLHSRIAGLHLVGVERQVDYANLARRNAEAADAQMEVVTADLAMLPEPLRQRSFDHVIMNPPYYHAAARSAAQDEGRESALAEDTPLATWVDQATRRLAPKGRLHVIQRADRLADLLQSLDGRLGSVELLPIAPRTGRAAQLILLRAQKGGRAALRLHAPLVLHSGDSHTSDGDSYRAEITDILRNGHALTWPK